MQEFNTVKLYGSLIRNCATTGNFVKSSADLISPLTSVRRVTEYHNSFAKLSYHTSGVKRKIDSELVATELIRHIIYSSNSS
jgi:hypothetical protein